MRGIFLETIWFPAENLGVFLSYDYETPLNRDSHHGKIPPRLVLPASAARGSSA